ncbi:phage antirepressor protein [Streptococcus sp. SGI.013]|uniref:phage antirepressor protein n=1 Tax=unclassified Streptococcus TaxID=2608887 RepID=UPI003D01D3FC
MTNKIIKLERAREPKPDYTAMTFKELKDWINDAVDYAEMIQDFDKCIPANARERYQGLSQEIFNVLESVSIMLDDKTLVYDRQREQSRLDRIKKEN